MLKAAIRNQNQIPFSSSMKKKSSNVDKRNGTATVELAVCLPVLVILVFGGIEAAHFVQLKQNLTICAYEAAKTATQSNGTSQAAVNRFNEIATAQGIQNATITMTPSVNSATSSGTQVTVTVSAPAEPNYEMPVSFFKGTSLKAKVVMIRQQF